MKNSFYCGEYKSCKHSKGGIIMSMEQKWHVIGIKFNDELNKDMFIDHVVENCITIDEAIEKAKNNGIKKITGAFLHSQLVEDKEV